jgi:predicted DsbA family dithiol-disulfide isomerase
MDIKGMLRTLSRTAAKLGLPFGENDHIYNSRLAQEMGLWSETKKSGDEFHTAVFKAYFVDGKNIGKVSILAELAASVGLPTDEASEILAKRSFKAAVDEDWALSKEMSITAVPTFVMNHERLVGAQPYEALEKLLAQSGVEPK